MSEQDETGAAQLDGEGWLKMVAVTVAFVLALLLLHFAGQGTMVIGSV